MAVDADAPPVGDVAPARSWFDHLDDIPRAWFIVGLTAIVSLPLLVALVALHSPRWYPLLDWAQTEIRVRDVWSSHPPLIGLAGRIGPFGPNGGSHPGPMSFYALWPVWTLFGRSAFGMYAGTVALDISAIALSIWVAYRRGGAVMALAIATTLALLMRAYGAFMLTTPWNPYLPVLWWFVFLLAVWSVLCADWPMLVVAVIAGSMAMQTHISYLGLVGGLGALVIALIVVQLVRKRVPQPRALLRWSGVAIVLFAVLWTPPVIDQVAHGHGSCKKPNVPSCGNLTVIYEHFSDPPEKAIGPGHGLDVFLTQINPLKLFAEPLVQNGSPRQVSGTKIPGAVLLVAWAGSVAVAWPRRVKKLLLLDAVLGAGIVLGYISAARIFGDVWFYLLLWAWGLTALMLFTIGWTTVGEIRARHGDDRKLARNGVIALVVVMLVATAIFGVDAATTDVMSPRLNDELAHIVPPTVDAVSQMKANGVKGPYLVTWLPEAQAIGSEGYGLLNELLRHGFDVNAAEVFRPGSTRYHVMDPNRASAQVHLATGPDILCWQRDSRYRQVAAYDPRTDAERAEFGQLHAQVVDDLRREGLGDLVPQVENNLFMLALLPRIPEQTRHLMSRMLALALPVAVFTGPVGEPARNADGYCT